jgi:hypothetical protein
LKGAIGNLRVRIPPGKVTSPRPLLEGEGVIGRTYGYRRSLTSTRLRQGRPEARVMQYINVTVPQPIKVTAKRQIKGELLWLKIKR